jgi:hypothetical protein
MVLGRGISGGNTAQLKAPHLCSKTRIAAPHVTPARVRPMGFTRSFDVLHLNFE